jgi:hypothetical protein
MSNPDWMRTDLQTDRPHPARVYDYLLGGTDNFPADREAAEAGMKANPAGRVPPRENRAFLRRAVQFLAAEAGIRQFLDVGTGIPTSPNVHEVAQGIAPDSRILYVDNDPIVLAHARTLLTSHPEGRTRYINADLRDVEAILNAPEVRDTFDPDQPIGVLFIAIMHFVADDWDPYGIVGRILDGLPSGSYMALSHLTGDFDPEAWERVAAIYRRTGVIMRVRSKPEIARFFDGLEMVEPGLDLVHRWRPDPGEDPDAVTDAQVAVYGGVARRP